MPLIKGPHLSLDYSYQHITISELTKTSQLPDSFAQLKQKLVKGEFRNPTENRPVSHCLARSIHSVVDKKKSTRFCDIVRKLRSGRWLGSTGQPITDVVNLGVGGSDLGPLMGAAALNEFADDATLHNLNVHFVSSMDGGQLHKLLPTLDAETTLFIIASKSFGTIDTLANVATVREWVKPVLNDDGWLAHHVIGVSSNAQRMVDYGIPAAHQLTFGEGVGGRYSLWSAIGLSIALATGLHVFEQMLAGARAMDEHFVEAPIEQNIPVLMALYGAYNREQRGINNLAILPYDGRLQMLPSYLQQLDMESNGKQCRYDGEAIDYATGPIIWGGHGPNGQHAFFQHLHQGYDDFAADFIIVLSRHAPGFSSNVADALAAQQRLSVANALAHRRLMWFGSSDGTPRNEYPGKHPSNALVMEELTPESFGALIAAYEHKVFTQGVIWQINSFDQPGVEKGKKIATEIYDAIENGSELSNIDESTAYWINKLR
ncbi:glucose-6-phosphate isomerase [Idiomarina aquatica]|uniref:Glucose-6-phosphate isomerase n=1 Tax=Idiomarina aquatica TaxID=1327752 RepID=A0A4R6PQI4_9GAMM|nr:glucose-6-phosphate isomerase [Idiomarina aquatica]TDP40254.1 glucose-6-phosphate isomerase [Idiomarina aquatica]